MRDAEFRCIEDHEEWLRVAEKSDGGVFWHARVMVYNLSAPPSSSRRLIAYQRVVENRRESADSVRVGKLAGQLRALRFGE